MKVEVISVNQASTCSPVEEIVEFFARGPSRDEIAAFHLSDAVQEYIRSLLGKNTAGTLTREEGRELDEIMVLNEVVSLIRARVHTPQRSDGQHTTQSAHPSA